MHAATSHPYNHDARGGVVDDDRRARARGLDVSHESAQVHRFDCVKRARVPVLDALGDRLVHPRERSRRRRRRRSSTCCRRRHRRRSKPELRRPGARVICFTVTLPIKLCRRSRREEEPAAGCNAWCVSGGSSALLRGAETGDDADVPAKRVRSSRHHIVADSRTHRLHLSGRGRGNAAARVRDAAIGAESANAERVAREAERLRAARASDIAF